jgi:hypothetical protein
MFTINSWSINQQSKAFNHFTKYSTPFEQREFCCIAFVLEFAQCDNWEAMKVISDTESWS